MMPTVAINAVAAPVAAARHVKASRQAAAVRGSPVSARKVQSAKKVGRKALKCQATMAGFSRDMYLSLDEGVAEIGGKAASSAGIGENVFSGSVADAYLKKQVRCALAPWCSGTVTDAAAGGKR